MKLRYSILTLLAVTTYIAVVIAGLVEPTRLGGGAIYALWIGALMICANFAAGEASPKRAFARGFMVVCLVCVALAMLARRPGEALLASIEENGILVIDSEYYQAALSYAQLGLAHASLLLALSVGCIAVWCYRRSHTA